MKRSDLDTYTVLEAVHQGNVYGRLTPRYPHKVITAALERELHTGHIDYGTSIASPWLTDEGRAWLEHDATTELTRHDQKTR